MSALSEIFQSISPLLVFAVAAGAVIVFYALAGWRHTRKDLAGRIDASIESVPERIKLRVESGNCDGLSYHEVSQHGDAATELPLVSGTQLGGRHCRRLREVIADLAHGSPLVGDSDVPASVVVTPTIGAVPGAVAPPAPGTPFDLSRLDILDGVGLR